MKIKYYTNLDNKRQYSLIDADETFASGYQEFQREEWRVEKDRERNEAYYTLTAMEDEKGFQAADKRNGCPLEQMIVRMDRAERLSKIRTALSGLTARQMEVVTLLRKGKTPSEIAEILGISKQSVNDIRKSVQKKFKEFL